MTQSKCYIEALKALHIHCIQETKTNFLICFLTNTNYLPQSLTLSSNSSKSKMKKQNCYVKKNRKTNKKKQQKLIEKKTKKKT